MLVRDKESIGALLNKCVCPECGGRTSTDSRMHLCLQCGATFTYVYKTKKEKLNEIYE